MGVILKSEEIQRLLSEYAAGRIGEEDRRQLFQAALEDQALFDILLQDHPIAEIMTDPAARAELRAALLQGPPRRPRQSSWAWLWRPWPLTAAATAMLAVLAVIVTQYVPQSSMPPESRLAVQKIESPSAPPPPSERAAVADKPVGGVTGGSGSAAPSPGEQAVRRKRAADEALQPSAPAISVVVGGVVGGVPGGVIGGIVRSSEEPKRTVVVPAAKAFGEEPSKRKSEIQLAAAVPDLRIQWLRGDADGQFQEAPSDAAFTAGDRVRLRLQPQAAGYLAVVEMDEAGRWILIYPSEGSAAVLVESGAAILLPANQAWEIGPKARERRLLAVFSREAQPPLIAPEGTLLRPENARIFDILIPQR